uniref:Mitochondrial ribosomal protein S21 n=1 Tax=Romanomermis culicivorax TaxID=13658 RepID=A0A915L7A7_ROMCU
MRAFAGRVRTNCRISAFLPQPFGHKLFRGVAYAHERFLWRTVLVKNNDVDGAMRVLNKNLSREGLMSIVRRSKYYEYPCEQRNRMSHEYCKSIYNEDMQRKIAFIMRKNRPEPLPGVF